MRQTSLKVATKPLPEAPAGEFSVGKTSNAVGSLWLRSPLCTYWKTYRASPAARWSRRDTNRLTLQENLFRAQHPLFSGPGNTYFSSYYFRFQNGSLTRFVFLHEEYLCEAVAEICKSLPKVAGAKITKYAHKSAKTLF